MGKKKNRKRSALLNSADPVSPPIPTATSVGPNAGIRTDHGYAPWQQAWWPQAVRNRDRVQKSRLIDEKVPLVGKMNTMLPEEALGDGLSANSDSKNLKFRHEATEYFHRWGNTNAIDVRGEFNIYSCQAMLGTYMLRDGEVFVQKVQPADADDPLYDHDIDDSSVRALQLQFYRRDQIGNGNGEVIGTADEGFRWDDGILIDEIDKAIKCRILQRKGLGTLEFIDREMEHMIHVKMPSLESIHGTPACFRGADSALDLLDMRAFSKFSDKVRASFLGAIVTPSGAAPASMTAGITKGQTGGVDEKVRYYEIAGGVQMPVLRTGEQINFFSGQSMTFESQIDLLVNEIVTASCYPAEYLWKLSLLGSAAVRMMAKQVGKGHGRIRRPIREVFLQQVWEFVIGDAIDRDILDPVDDWNVIVCKGARDPTIDAGRDEKIEQEKIRSFTGTIEDYCDTLGLTGSKVRHARIDEIADNIRYGYEKHKLPWFLCVDPMTLQAISGVASAMNIDLHEIGEQLKKLALEKV